MHYNKKLILISVSICLILAAIIVPVVLLINQTENVNVTIVTSTLATTAEVETTIKMTDIKAISVNTYQTTMSMITVESVALLSTVTNEREAFSTYIIIVVTGEHFSAGTDAIVSLRIYGEHGNSSEFQLLRPIESSNPFEQGKTDYFKIRTLSLGELQKIKIQHDNSERFSGWYLVKVDINDLQTQKMYSFVCERWLATDEDDGAISREFDLTEIKEYNL